jgi:hypothetical protein
MRRRRQVALALRGPEPLRAPFARFSAAYRANGRVGECLDALKDDLADSVGDRVCETMRVARAVGGSRSSPNRVGLARQRPGRRGAVISLVHRGQVPPRRRARSARGRRSRTSW